MQQNGFAVSSVSEGSILITFRCFNEQSLANLRQLHTHKTLDRLFTETFCPEFVAEGLESLSLDISDDESEKCKENFKHMALMTSEHRITLLETATYRVVTENIAITGDLLYKLSLSQQHIDRVLGHSAHSVQTEMLFEIISRRPDTMFTQLVNTLRETGQSSVADFLINYHVTTVTSLPMELLELVLMGPFIKLFTGHYKSHYKTREAIAAAYSALAAVCCSWRQTMNGWSDSPTQA
jgi:hypothetical protein